MTEGAKTRTFLRNVQKSRFETPVGSRGELIGLKRAAGDGIACAISKPMLTVNTKIAPTILHHAETIVIEGKSYRMKDRIEP